MSERTLQGEQEPDANPLTLPSSVDGSISLGRGPVGLAWRLVWRPAASMVQINMLASGRNSHAEGSQRTRTWRRVEAMQGGQGWGRDCAT